MAAITNHMHQKMDLLIPRIYDDVKKDPNKLDPIFAQILKEPRDNTFHANLGLQNQRAIDAVISLHRIYNDPNSEDICELNETEKKTFQQDMRRYYETKLLQIFRGAVTQSTPAPSAPAPVVNPPAAAAPAPQTKTSDPKVRSIDMVITGQKIAIPSGETASFKGGCSDNMFKLDTGSTLILESGCRSNQVLLLPNSKLIIKDNCSDIHMCNPAGGGTYEIGNGCRNITFNGQPVNQSRENAGFRLPSAVEFIGADGQHVIIYQ